MPAPIGEHSARKNERDLTGQTWGYWTVLSPAGRNKRGAKQYNCRCICGTERVVVEAALLNGHSKSCGCRKGESRSSRIDLTGQTIYNWLVLAPAGRNKQGRKQYRCRCVCGKERIVAEAKLLYGGSKCCGCIKPKMLKKTTDLVGQTFGYWTVIEPADTNVHQSKRYLCRCRCGTERVVVASNLLKGLSKSCGCRGKDGTQLMYPNRKGNS